MDAAGIFQGKTALTDARSLLVVLSSSCQKYAALTAFSCEDRRLSYRDSMLVSGYNVYPAEIEDHVLRHPDIREATVISVTEKENEYVKLFVIPDNPDLDEEDVFHFCRQGLTSCKIP